MPKLTFSHPSRLRGSRYTPRRGSRVGRIALLILLVFFGFTLLKGRVVRVHDGDTVSVLLSGGRMEKVRLYGIDSPESAQRGGTEAAGFTRERAFLSEVELTVLGSDQYGRQVAIVRLPDGRLLNEELLRAGHAWVYRNYCREAICASWLLMEDEARKAGRGLWQDKNPQAPWDWRQAQQKSYR